MKEKRRSEEKEIAITATHWYDTERFSRYEIDKGQIVNGRFYVSKDQKGVKRIMVDLVREEELVGDGKEKAY